MSLLIFALPTLLVCAAYYGLRAKPSAMRTAMLLLVSPAWAIALWFMISSSQQTNDVGIMVEGMLFLATSVSALIATLAAIFFWRKV